jgi:hypothetical protein
LAIWVKCVNNYNIRFIFNVPPTYNSSYRFILRSIKRPVKPTVKAIDRQLYIDKIDKSSVVKNVERNIYIDKSDKSAVVNPIDRLIIIITDRKSYL